MGTIDEGAELELELLLDDCEVVLWADAALEVTEASSLYAEERYELAVELPYWETRASLSEEAKAGSAVTEEKTEAAAGIVRSLDASDKKDEGLAAI